MPVTLDENDANAGAAMMYADRDIRCDAAVAQSSHGEAAAAVPTRIAPTSVGMLLTSHILQDGELVLLVLKPSIWFILLSSLRFVAIVLILLFGAIILAEQLPARTLSFVEAAIFLIAGRIMWAVLQWMGRLYILTDMRILRLSGVFRINIFDCPLRKVSFTRVVRSMRERLTRLGTIEILPMDASCPMGQWQMVSKPHVVHEQILAALNRSRQGRAAARVA